MNRLLTGIITATAMSGLCAAPAHAAVFCVGTAPALATAFNIADNNGQDDDIRLQSGLYLGNFIYNANVAETGNLSISGGYNAACTASSGNPDDTIIDGGGAGRALVVSGRDNSDVSVSALTIRNGLGQTTGAGLDMDRWLSARFFNNVVINNVTAAGQDGSGGVEIDRTLAVFVHDNRFADNVGGKGGGLSVSDMNSAAIERNRFIDNHATMGGGGLEADTVGDLLLANNLFALNTSGEDGGAIDLNLETLGTAGTLQAVNNTLVANGAAEDGGAFDLKMVGDATVARLHNNLFWANTAGLLGRDMNIDNDDEQNGIASVVELGNNNFDQSILGFFTRLPVNIPASNFNAVNPLFVNQAGGQYGLQAGSPMIDAGNTAIAGVGATDVNGDARVQGAAVDIGAMERLVSVDSDGDGIADNADNCTQVANPDQRDSNGDGFGNLCDGDLNNDNVVNVLDLGLLRLVFFTTDADADFNGDGQVNPIDLGLFRGMFGRPPGPSGVAN